MSMDNLKLFQEKVKKINNIKSKTLTLSSEEATLLLNDILSLAMDNMSLKKEIIDLMKNNNVDIDMSGGSFK